MLSLEDRYLGCMMGAAVGDALGWSREASVGLGRRDSAVRYLPVEGRTGRSGASTQLMLFVAEGLLRTHNRLASQQPADPVSGVHRALLRWLDTQRDVAPPPRSDGWLASVGPLYARRTRSTVTTQALRTGLMGRVQHPINNSREAAAVASVMPVALVSGWEAFGLARDVAALTHGHPAVGLAAGAFAHLLQQLVLGAELSSAVESTWAEVEGLEATEGLLQALDAALDAGDLGDPGPDGAAAFGEGRDAESALAVALYCASGTDSFDVGMAAATQHPGAVAWTGAIAGALLGARSGLQGIAEPLREGLELGPVVTAVATHLHQHFARSSFEPDEDDWNRYPG